MRLDADNVPVSTVAGVGLWEPVDLDGVKLISRSLT
jgi:hypothetical protein